MKKDIKKNLEKKDDMKVIKLIVFRSNSAIYVQAFDVSERRVFASSSSLKTSKKKPTDVANEVGNEFAKKIAKVKAKFIFDRNGYLYHGQVKALADGLRQGGIKI